MDDGALAAALVEGLGRLTIHLWPDRTGRSGRELLADAGRVATDLDRRGLLERPIGAVLETSWDGLAFLVATVLAGARLCSLPEAPRAAGDEAHRRHLARVADELDLGAVVTARPGQAPGEILTFAELGRVPVPDSSGHRLGSTTAHPVGGFELVQFTSGSTGDPKGIVLSARAVLANVTAVIPSALEPGFVAVSWLPLSHDMGLIGTTLTPMVAAGQHGGHGPGRATLALIPPKAFIRRPGLWFDACSELGATFTASPDFGYRLATPLIGRGHDLSRLRCAATGAEPVRAATIRAFERAAAGAGLSPTAVRPCYGLAEATLAVTITAPTHPWRSVHVDRDRLDAGEVVTASDVGLGLDQVDGLPAGCGTDRATVELTDVGAPLPGFDVRIAGDGVGTIEVRGPSLLDRYTDGSDPVDGDGWMPTMDLGFLVDGALHVVGRRDDVLVVGGRNLHAHDLEDSAAGPGTRPGAVMVVRGLEGHPVVLFEPGTDAPGDAAALGALCSSIGARVLDRSGVAPSVVLACGPGSLPRTPSGKPRRRVAEGQLRDGILPILHAWGQPVRRGTTATG